MKSFVFPGQGSQSVGMGKDLYDTDPHAKKIMDSANDILGFDLTQIIFNGPLEDLTKTIYAQPALVTISYATLINFLDGAPIQDKCQYVLGHSLGEYSALVAAGVFTFEDALKLVYLRGQAMQEAVPEGQGMMAAVLSLDIQSLALCLTGTCVIANDNAPGQIVISGLKQDVLETIENAKERGAKRCIPLPVSAPFHSPLMQPAADVMTGAFESVAFSSALVPVVSNVTALPSINPLILKKNLTEQICGQVRFTESIAYLKDHGVTTFMEMGPGQVLTNLIKRI